MRRALLIGAGLGVSSLGVVALLTAPETGKNEAFEMKMNEKIPSRSQQLDAMRASTKANPFDLLIIGGGATGAGCALDASARGIKTCESASCCSKTLCPSEAHG